MKAEQFPCPHHICDVPKRHHSTEVTFGLKGAYPTLLYFYCLYRVLNSFLISLMAMTCLKVKKQETGENYITWSFVVCTVHK